MNIAITAAAGPAEDRPQDVQSCASEDEFAAGLPRQSSSVLTPGATGSDRARSGREVATGQLASSGIAYSRVGAGRLAGRHQRGHREGMRVPDVSCPATVVTDVPVLTAPEQINISTAYGLRAALASAAHGQATVIIDMTRTRSCDTVGLHVLVRAHKRALAAGGELRLVISSPDVLRIFAVTGIDRVIRHFASLQEALGQIPADADQPPRPSDAA
jgi:anti-sigma B factor antagonist